MFSSDSKPAILVDLCTVKNLSESVVPILITQTRQRNRDAGQHEMPQLVIQVVNMQIRQSNTYLTDPERVSEGRVKGLAALLNQNTLT